MLGMPHYLPVSLRFHLLVCGGVVCDTVPALPQRQWTSQAQAELRISTGHIGFVCLGCSLITKVHGGIAHLGMVASYQRPFFRVHYYDGSYEDLTGDQIAAGPRPAAVDVRLVNIESDPGARFSCPHCFLSTHLRISPATILD